MSEPRGKDKRAAYDMKSVMRELFMPYQVDWIKDNSRLKIFEKSRRIGGTYSQSFRDSLKCVSVPGTKIFYSSADLTAAGEYGDEIDKWASRFNAAASALADLDEHESRKLPDMLFADEDQGLKMKLKEFANGSRIYLLSSNPKAFRSKGGDIVWDEAAHHEQDVKMWSAASPAAMWGYSINVLSTHNGPNTVFNQLLKQIRSRKKNAGWSSHTVTILDAAAQGLVGKIMGRAVTDEEIAEWIQQERAKCLTEAQWLEEYMCIPQDESTALISYSAITSQSRPNLLRELDSCKGPLWVGFDVARKRHHSVVYVLEGGDPALSTRKVLLMDRLPFSAQKDLLWPILRLPQVRRCCIDATGIGAQIAEEAVEKFGRKVEAVTFSAAVNERLAMDLVREFDDATIWLPGDLAEREQAMQTEGIHSLRKFVTAAGNARYDAKANDEAGHADHFWALALAVHAARNTKSGPVRVTSASARRTAKTESVTKGFFAAPQKGAVEKWSRPR